MTMAIRAALLIICLSVCAHAQTRTLALYSGPARGLDDESRTALQSELQRLLAPAGLHLIWKQPTDRKAGEDFDFVTVVSFQGLCSPADFSSTAPVSGGASLADTSVAHGRVLPFFHVDCARVATMLRPEAEPSRVQSRHALFGRALARVMAHEIYHIVGQTAEHQERGIAKAALSMRDLTAPRLDFDLWSLTLMRPPSVASVVGSDDADTGR